MIIDFHAHCFPPKIAKKATGFLCDHYNWGTAYDASPNGLANSMDQAGVDCAVIHSTATKPEQVQSINDFTKSLLNERFYGFGTIHPGFDGVEDEIIRIHELGLKGIKLHNDFQGFDADDPIAFPIYEKAQGFLPILFHAGDENLRHSEPAKLRNVHDRFPELTMICAHMGGYRRFEQAKKHIIGQDVFIDTSSVMHILDKSEMREMIYAHGVDKCLFGTDFPLNSHQHTLEMFLNLELSKEDNEKILYKNAVKLLCVDF